LRTTISTPTGACTLVGVFFGGGRVASLRSLQKENIAANIEQKNKEIEKLRKNFLIFQKKFCHDKKNIYFRALFKAA
jgi:hypothetical protein